MAAHPAKIAMEAMALYAKRSAKKVKLFLFSMKLMNVNLRPPKLLLSNFAPCTGRM